MRASVDERFWSKVLKGPSVGDCWLWTGATDGNGYGKFSLDGRSVRAHRVAYELVHKPFAIPDGMHIHHTCEVRWCVNPAHLQVLTPEQHLSNYEFGNKISRVLRVYYKEHPRPRRAQTSAQV